MKQLSAALVVSLLAFSAMAVQDYNGNEIPLPPPTGPGNSGPQPAPPPYAPPEQQPQPPQYPEPAPQPPQYPSEQSYSLGVVNTTRNNVAPYTFRPTYGLDRVLKVQVTSVLKKVNVQSVTVFYANGQGGQVLSNMGGVLREGQAMVATLSGYPVERIVVQASSSAFWSSKGAFRVDVTVDTTPQQEVQLPTVQQ